MENTIRWLRISFWAGAVLDILAAIQMLIPRGLRGHQRAVQLPSGERLFLRHGDGRVADAGMDRLAHLGRS